MLSGLKITAFDGEGDTANESRLSTFCRFGFLVLVRLIDLAENCLCLKSLIKNASLDTDEDGKLNSIFREAVQRASTFLRMFVAYLCWNQALL